MHFTRHSIYDAGRPRPGDRPRRRRLHLGRPRPQVPRRARRPVRRPGRATAATELAEAAAKQASELAFFPLWSYAHPTAIELAERLAALRPGRPQPGVLHHRRRRGRRDGLEAGQAVLQADRQADEAQGDQPRSIAYHGTPQGALSITGIPDAKKYFEPLVPGAHQGAEHQLLPRPAARATTSRRSAAGRPTGSPRRSSSRAPTPSPRSSSSRCRTPAAASRRRPGYLAAGPRDLRPVRRAAGRRRDHLRLRPDRRRCSRRKRFGVRRTSSPAPRA